MTSEELAKVKHCLQAISREIVELTSVRTEVEMRIEALKSVESILVTLLPTDDRINRLFQ